MKKIVLQTEYLDFKLFYLKKDRAIGGLISRKGTYEPFETETILRFVKPESVCVDVGANIGAYTLPMARRSGPEGRVYAFEPEEENRILLIQNLIANHADNVAVSPVAITEKQEQKKLYISKTNLGDHRLFAEEGKPRKYINVLADSLDHQLNDVLGEKRRIDVIKCDTQGFEPLVIRGAQAVIRRYRPAVFLEYWPWGFLRSGGNKNEMIMFLLSVYRKMHFIDEKNHRLRSVGQEFIDTYCTGHQGYLHCNLAFLP